MANLAARPLADQLAADEVLLQIRKSCEIDRHVPGQDTFANGLVVARVAPPSQEDYLSGTPLDRFNFVLSTPVN